MAKVSFKLGRLSNGYGYSPKIPTNGLCFVMDPAIKIVMSGSGTSALDACKSNN